MSYEIIHLLFGLDFMYLYGLLIGGGLEAVELLSWSHSWAYLVVVFVTC